MTFLTLTDDDLTALTKTEWDDDLGELIDGADTQVDAETVRLMAQELLTYRRAEARRVEQALNGGQRRSALLSEAAAQAMRETLAEDDDMAPIWRERE